MNILIDCNELINPDYVYLESIVGGEGCWAYHKLRIYLKSQKTDIVYRAKIPYLSAILRVPETILRPMLDHLPSTLAAHKGQFWQLLEITKELDVLNRRVNGLVNGHVNKGKGITDPITIKDPKKGGGAGGGKQKLQKLPLVFPEWVMADGEVVELLSEWIAFRAQKNKKVSQKALDLNLKPYLFDTTRLKRALESTIAKGWQGIYEDKGSGDSRGHSAVLNRDGSVSGQIDFNRLPASAKVSIINDNVVRQFEEKERLEKLNKNKEIGYDNRSTDGKTLEGIVRAVPKLGTKIGHRD